ncbi:unnamed protein product, partial [Prorocentrum cordatum]
MERVMERGTDYVIDVLNFSLETVRSSSWMPNTIAMASRSSEKLTDSVATKLVALAQSLGGIQEQDNSAPPNEELAKAQATTAELRTQSAAHAAREARRDELCHNGRLVQTVVAPSGARGDGFTMSELVGKFVGTSTNASTSEPYVFSHWQRDKLKTYRGAPVEKAHVGTVRLSTHPRSQETATALSDIFGDLAGIGFEFKVATVADSHVREVRYSSGCPRNGAIRYHELDTQPYGIADGVPAKLAEEARPLPQADSDRLKDSRATAAARVRLAEPKAAVAQSAAVLRDQRIVRTEQQATGKLQDCAEAGLVTCWINQLGYIYKKTSNPKHSVDAYS